MNEAQIKFAIRSGGLFFGVTPQGDVLARYVLFGPVFCWKKNQMIPTFLQGEDLCWWLQAADEENIPMSTPD